LSSHGWQSESAFQVRPPSPLQQAGQSISMPQALPCRLAGGSAFATKWLVHFAPSASESSQSVSHPVPVIDRRLNGRPCVKAAFPLWANEAARRQAPRLQTFPRFSQMIESRLCGLRDLCIFLQKIDIYFHKLTDRVSSRTYRARLSLLLPPNISQKGPQNEDHRTENAKFFQRKTTI
jgi:hypothetical protein